MFDILTYSRNYLALKALGIPYNQEQHHAYKQNLKQYGLEPMSLKSALQNFGSNDLGNVLDQEDIAADIRLEHNKPVLEQYLAGLAQAVQTPLHLTSTKYFADSFKNFGRPMGLSVDGQRQWSLSRNEIDIAEPCAKIIGTKPIYHFFDMNRNSVQREVANTSMPIHHQIEAKTL